MHYDEQTVLVRYLCNHYTHLMTKPQLAGLRALLGEAKARAASGAMAAKLRASFVDLSKPGVSEAIEKGSDAFRRGIADRLLRDHEARINLNRCPQCDRIPRTPRAKQCPWCKHSWHNQG